MCILQPVWFGWWSCVNLCQLRHLTRKSYDIGGGDTLRDLVIPSLCLCVPCLNVAYFYYEIAKIRGEMVRKGASDLFSSNIREDVVYHSVLVKKQTGGPKKR